jgi:microfibrillar-associated protein 1
LQKDYHVGAFFRTFDENDLKNSKRWNWDAPTAEDRFDKNILPAVMAVKNFGKKGRTKHTHLKDVDTTFIGGNRDDVLFSNSHHGKRKLGGMGPVDYPFHKRARD